HTTCEVLAADQHRKVLEAFTAVARQRMPKCRRTLKQCGASLLDHARKGARIAGDLSWGDGDTSTADERKEQFESRDVECHRRDGHEPIMSSKASLFPHRQEYVCEAAMC